MAAVAAMAGVVMRAYLICTSFVGAVNFMPVATT